MFPSMAILERRWGPWKWSKKAWSSLGSMDRENMPIHELSFLTRGRIGTVESARNCTSQVTPSKALGRDIILQPFNYSIWRKSSRKLRIISVPFHLPILSIDGSEIWQGTTLACIKPVVNNWIKLPTWYHSTGEFTGFLVAINCCSWNPCLRLRYRTASPMCRGCYQGYAVASLFFNKKNGSIWSR